MGRSDETINDLTMNLLALSSLLTISTCLILFFIVLYFGKEKIHRLWAVFNIVVATWGTGTFLAGMAKSPESSLLAWRIAIIGGIFLGVFFFHMVCVYGDLKRKKTIIFAYSQAVIFAVISLTTKIPFPDWQIIFNTYSYPVPNIGYATILVFWFIFVALGFYELSKIYKKSNGFKRLQSFYLLFGFLIGFTGGASVNFPILGINIYPAGNFTIPIYALMITYAILKYQLLDIRVIIKKAVLYSFGISLISGIIMGVSLLSGWFINNIHGFQFWVIPLITGSVAFIIGELYWRKSKEVEKLKYEFIKNAPNRRKMGSGCVRWSFEFKKYR